MGMVINLFAVRKSYRLNHALKWVFLSLDHLRKSIKALNHKIIIVYYAGITCLFWVMVHKTVLVLWVITPAGFSGV